jgi:hypothetical protein
MRRLFGSTAIATIPEPRQLRTGTADSDAIITEALTLCINYAAAMPACVCVCVPCSAEEFYAIMTKKTFT